MHNFDETLPEVDKNADFWFKKIKPELDFNEFK